MEELEKQNTGGPTYKTWLLIVIAIIYGVSPFDIIPDWIPVAGWIDDAIVIITAIVNLIKKLKEA